MDKSCKGYTLVELLVAIAIGAVIMFGVTTTFVGSMQTSATAIRTAQLHEQIRATMNIITRDLMRSGYSSTAQNDVGTNTFNNNFLSSASTGEDVRLWSGGGTSAISYTSSTSGDCVTFSYDAAPTPDGVLTAGSTDYRGFKFSNGSIWKRMSAPGPDKDCTFGSWSQLTTDDIVVSELSFKWVDYTNLTDVPTGVGSPTPAGCTSTPLAGDNTLIFQRSVLVTLSAYSTKDNTLKETLTENVKVRNNAYNPCGL